MYSRIACVAAIVVMMGAVLFAQEKPNKFLVRVGGATLGSEEYTITRNASGYKLKSKQSTLQDGRSTHMEQEQLLLPDLTLKRYTLMVAVPEGLQTIQASRENDKIRMSVRVPDRETKAFSVPLAANTVILDNMVVSQYQVLLDSLTAAPPMSKWGFLVPQQLTLLPGAVTAIPRQEKATLNGSEITVRKYSINAGGLVMEMWSDIASSKLMRVWVPTQKVEFIREGFTLGTGSAPQPATKPGS